MFQLLTSIAIVVGAIPGKSDIMFRKQNDREIYAKQKKTINFGLLKFDDDYTINFDKNPVQTVDKTLLKNDEKFFENYLKFYLIANLPLEKIKQKFVQSIKERETEQMIKNIMKEKFSDIVKFVKEKMG